jgi:hypothetical protein
VQGGGGSGGGGGAPTGPWACVGDVEYPQAPAASFEGTFHFWHLSASLGDPEDLAPFEGVIVDVCGEATDCATPLDTGVTDADGAVMLTLPTPGSGFAGYLRASGDNLVTMQQHILPPIFDATSPYLSTSARNVVFTTDSFANLADILAGVTVDPTKGHVITTTVDCDGVFSEAVDVTVNGVSPDDVLTSDSVWFNVEPGSIEIVGKLADGTEIARVVRTVTAGEVTSVMFGPTPTP